MSNPLFTTTTINIEKKVLARLKKMSQKSASNGLQQSVSKLIRLAVKQYLAGGVK